MPMAFAKNHDPFDSLSSPSSTNSNGYVFGVTNYQSEETHPVIDFKAGLDYVKHKNGSFLGFEQNDDISENYCSIWDKNQIRCNYRHSKGSTTSSYGCMKENPHGGEPFGWLNSEENGGTIQEFESNNKRPHEGESKQALKKQCASSTLTGKNKPKSTPPSKDQQSIAAKNRRERISERLKILQELVPNGSKVDLVTMLEKGFSYVKFLHLQVKVLATDEFWPVQAGKAPDISQVKEAIDAIL